MPRRRRARRGVANGAVVVVALAGALVLAACVPPPATTGAGASTPAGDTPSPEIAGTFDIGDGRMMYLECSGTGSPGVVLVSGQRGSAQDWSITTDAPASSAVFPQLAEHTRVCAYDRPGTPVGDRFSRSDPAPQPTSAADIVADLRALLEVAGESGPHVLVGHSAGGLAARLYAATYPDEVLGLVLVDALSPGLQDAETPEQWKIQRILLEGDITESLVEYPDLERIDADESFAQVRAAPALRPMPLVVISADESYGPLVPELIAAGGLPPEVPEDFGYVVDAAQRQSQAGLALLVPGAEHMTETHSGHNVHQEQPVLVTDAILGVVDRLRAEAEPVD